MFIAVKVSEGFSVFSNVGKDKTIPIIRNDNAIKKKYKHRIRCIERFAILRLFYHISRLNDTFPWEKLVMGVHMQ